MITVFDIMVETKPKHKDKKCKWEMFMFQSMKDREKWQEFISDKIEEHENYTEKQFYLYPEILSKKLLNLRKEYEELKKKLLEDKKARLL